MQEMNGQIALVTGAGRGIGRCDCESLAKEGGNCDCKLCRKCTGGTGYGR